MTCRECPMRKSMPQMHRDLIFPVIGKILDHGGFPCHHKHPKEHALTDGLFKHTDCTGYKLMLANQRSPNKHSKIVNGFKKNNI